MDWLTFITSIVNALAWPGTVITVIAILRKPLASLISEIITVKWKGLEIAFDKGIKELVIEAEKAALPPPPSSPPPREIGVSDTISVGGEIRARLEELPPPAAILMAWFDLETALRELASRHAIAESNKRPTFHLAQELWKKGVLDDNTFTIFMSIRNLRNQAVHVRPDSITPAQALEYISTVRRLITKLKEA